MTKDTDTILVRRQNGERIRKEVPDPSKSIENILLCQLAQLELIAANRELTREEQATLKTIIENRDLLPKTKLEKPKSGETLKLLSHINGK